MTENDHRPTVRFSARRGVVSQPQPITASTLYNLVSCPHRVTMDLFADPRERDEVSPFVQLLLERGQAHEDAIISGLGQPFLDLSRDTNHEKESCPAKPMGRSKSVRVAPAKPEQTASLRKRYQLVSAHDARVWLPFALTAATARGTSSGNRRRIGRYASRDSRQGVQGGVVRAT